MPVVRPATVSYTLVEFTLNVPQMRAVATFSRHLDQDALGDMVILVEGTDLAEMMIAAATPGKSRAEDVTDAVYAYALSKGLISGSIA